jgi:hypothetical protein
MKDAMKYTLFDIFSEYNPLRPQLYYCTDETCSNELKNHKKIKKMYFRIFSDKCLSDNQIEVT